MSGAVDTKTVEMRFDNSDFEKNAKQSMSTLEKLKTALKLDGASSGLKEIEKASDKLDFKQLHKGVDDTGKKFNVLETIATGALLKIGSVAAETGLKVAKSLTIDQVASGWNKYEQKVSAVQTIMANLRDTEGKFSSDAAKMDYVTGYLDKLIWFSDETSYSFTEMTNNLGKFVAVGQDLDSSVTAIQGIATWAAMAGQRTSGAARAMYNISQALGVGAMTTIDWKSIENANMATAEFKETAIDTAVALGKLKKGQVTVESFRESLQTKWFDSDVMMAVFEKYGEAAEKIHQYATDNGVTVYEAIRDLKKADKKFSDTLGFRAFAAAQEAKTFSEVVEATADAVSTKWTRIFENIFGNYLQAKDLWTNFSEDLWDVFAKPLDVLNDIMTAWNSGFLAEGPQNILERWLESKNLTALGEGVHFLKEEIEGLAGSGADLSKFEGYRIKQLADGTKQLITYEKTSTGVIVSHYSNLLSGREMLIQGFKNIFDTLIHDVEDENGELESMSFFGSLKRGLQEVIYGTSKTSEIVPIVAKKIWELTNRFKDFTEKLKPSMETSLKIKNAFKGLFSIFKIAGKFVGAIVRPFSNLFGRLFKGAPKTVLDLADSIGTWIQKFDDFLEQNKVFDTVSEKITNGLDALSTGANELSLALTGMTVKDLGRAIKQKIFSFFENFDFKGNFQKVGNFFKIVYESIKTGVNNISKLLTGLSAKDLYTKLKGIFVSFFENYDFKGTFNKVIGFFRNIISQLKQTSMSDLPSNLTPLQRFWLGIKKVFEGMKKFFSSIAPAFTWLTDFISNIFSKIAGAFSKKSNTDEVEKAHPFLEGLKKMFEGVFDFFVKIGPALGKVAEWIGQFFSKLGGAIATWAEGKTPEEIVGGLLKGGFILSLTEFFHSLAGLGKSGQGIGKTISNAFSSIKDVFKSYSRDVNASAALKISLAIGILAGSLWLLAQIPADDMERAGSALAKIGVAVGAFIAIMSKMKLANAALGLFAKRDTSVGKDAGNTGFLGSLKNLLSGVIGNSIFANDSTAKFVKIALGILLAAVAAKKIVDAVMKASEAIVKLSKIPEDQLKKGGKIFAQIALVFGAFAFLASIGGSATGALFAAIAGYVLVLAVKKFIDVLADLGSNQKKMDNIKKVVDQFPKVFESLSSLVKWVLIIAALMAVAQIVLTAFASKKLVNSAGVAKVLKQFGKNFVRMALALVLASAAFAIMANASSSLNSGDINKISGFLLGFTAIAGVLQVVSVAFMTMSKQDTDLYGAAAVLKQFGKNFIRIALSLVLVSAAFWLFSKIKFDNASIGEIGLIFLVFTIIVGALSLLAKSVAKDAFLSAYFVKNVKAIGVMFLAIAASLLIVAKAFQTLGAISFDNASIWEIGAIFGLFLVIVGAIGLIAAKMTTNSAKPMAGILSMAGLIFVSAYSLTIVAEAVSTIASLKLTSDQVSQINIILDSFLGIVGVIGIVAAYFTSETVKPIAGILSMAGLIYVAAYSLTIVAEAVASIVSLKMDPDSAEQVELILGGFLGIVAVMALIGGALSGATSGLGALGILAVAALVFVAAIALSIAANALSGLVEAMSKADANKVTTILDAFLNVIKKLVKIGAIVGALGIVGIVGLGALAIFIVAIGAACLLAGIGIMLAAVGLAKLTDALSSFIDTVAEKGPGFVANIKTMFNEFLDAFVEAGKSGKIKEATSAVLSGIGEGIDDSSDTLSNSVGDLVSKTLTSIDDKTKDDQISSIVGNIISSLVRGLVSGLGKIAAVGVLFPLIFVSSFAEGVSDILPGLTSTMSSAAKGIIDAIPDFVMAIYDLKTAMVFALESVFDMIGVEIESYFKYLWDWVTNPFDRSERLSFSEFLASNRSDFKDALLSKQEFLQSVMSETTGKPVEIKQDAELRWKLVGGVKIYDDEGNVVDNLKGVYKLVDQYGNVFDEVPLAPEGYKWQVKYDTKNHGQYDGYRVLVKDTEKAAASAKEAVEEAVEEGYVEGFKNEENSASEEAAKEVTEASQGLIDKAKAYMESKGISLDNISLGEGSTFDVSALKALAEENGLDYNDLINSVGLGGDINLAEGVNIDTSAVQSIFPGLSSDGSLNIMDFLGIKDFDVAPFKNALLSAFSLDSDSLSKLSENFPGLKGGTLKISEVFGIKEFDITDIETATAGMATSIETPITSLNSETWGRDIDSGLASGIDGSSDLVEAACKRVAEVIHSILGFSEPEKGPLSNFHTYAPDMIKLWCKGIDDNLWAVEESTNAIAETTSDGISSALSYVSDLIDNGMSDELTIRPIMDLSEIQNGMNSMSSMLSSQNGYAIKGTAKITSETAASMKPSASSTSPDIVQAEAGQTNNTFYIMNNDPDVVAAKISKILGNQTRRQKAVWAR